ncbi:MAG: hypothetical protein Kow0080_30610 [Candidatus Promineifilaceae bacterium]
MKKWKLFTFAVLALSLAFMLHKPNGAASADPILKELAVNNFNDGVLENTAVSASAVTLAPNATSGSYLSPVIDAPIPFNVIVPSWTGSTPPTATMQLLVRTGTVDGRWQPWEAIEAHTDWNEPTDEINHGELLLVPEADGRHQRIQFAVNFSRQSLQDNPALNEVMFILIDSTAGPSSAEMLRQAQQAQPEAIAETTMTNPRPTVIPRSVWCTSADCNYDPNSASYLDATHMIVHHTVSSNTPRSDWAPVVRAIWAFHTYPASSTCSSCRGWGDIGYNYLVDQNGVIYEGHLSRDYINEDVVGTHASGANSGSMGVALIGNFVNPADYPTMPGIDPPQVMIDSLIDLLSWKAEQRNINVFESSATLPYIDWGLPNLMGHRNVYGTTDCPGDQVFVLIPSIRQAVANRLGLVDDHIYVSETSAAFTKSNANWYEGDNECGHNGHSYYTWSTTDPNLSANWGEWQLDVPESGRYLLQVFIPYCRTGKSETAGAVYEVTHMNGTTSVLVNQQANVGLWTTIGEFDFEAGGNNKLYLDDLVTTDNNLGMWFDDVRLLKINDFAQVKNSSPSDMTWFNTRDITFTWTITSSMPVLTTTLKAGTDSGLSNVVLSQSWPNSTLSYSHTFTQDYPLLYWQVTANVRTTSGLVTAVSSTPLQFGIDTTPPTATIDAIYSTNAGYLLQWSGIDTGAGIDSYTIEYQPAGEATWTPWLTRTQQTAGFFTPPVPGTIYNFRVQASDILGNNEAPHTTPDVTSEQAVALSHAIMLPVITKN